LFYNLKWRDKLKRKKYLERKIEIFIELLRPDLDPEVVERCAHECARLTRFILLIGLLFSIGSIAYGTFIMKFFFPNNIPFQSIMLLNLPWLIGFILGPAIYKIFLPKYKEIYNKYFMR